MVQLLKLLKSHHFDVHFASTSQKTEHSFDSTSLGVKEHEIELNSASFDAFLKALDPKIVVFDRFITEEQFGWKVDEICPDALKILDTEDLHFLREERKSALKSQSKTTGLLSDKAKRELAAIYRCDLSLIISTYEYRLLKDHYAFPETYLHYLPFLVERDAEQKAKAFSERNHFVSIGNFKHKPNYDMVLYTSQQVWPLIREQLPHAEWHIYGAYMPNSIRHLHSAKKGIMVKGRAEEAVSTLQNYKVMLAYLRYGAGLKQKCIDAMLAGTPISTTDIGAEGLTVNQGFAGSIETNLKRFIDKSVLLYTEESTWKEKQANGFSMLESSFSPQLHSQKMIDKIQFYLDNLSEIRAKGIVGQLMKYHLLKSTKYMSLWIQEKNKRE